MVLDAFAILLTHLKHSIFIKSLTMLCFLLYITKGTNSSGCSKTNKTNLHAKPTRVISIHKQQPSVFNCLLHFRSKRVNSLWPTVMTHLMTIPWHVNKATGWASLTPQGGRAAASTAQDGCTRCGSEQGGGQGHNWLAQLDGPVLLLFISSMAVEHCWETSL